MAKRPIELVANEETIFEMPPEREAWIGRLRYVVVPIIAVLAIVTAIFVLQEPSSRSLGGGTQVGDANPISVASAGGVDAPAPRIGYAAPDFALRDVDGRQIKLSDFRGQAVFLNFFASWCPPCRAEMPDVLATYEQNKASGMVVLAVDMQEEPEVVKAYAQSVGLSFPIALDRSGYVTGIYRITAIPTSFFIDKDGIIRDMQIGAMSKDLMRSRLQKAM